MHFITAFRYDTEKWQVFPIKQERVKTKGAILSNIKKIYIYICVIFFVDMLHYK